MKPHFYNCTLVRVIDGDTIDVDIDLGFNVWIRKSRVRLVGIDTPESRTRNLAEKKLGLAAKERLKELCGEKLRVESHGKGKYGRVLGIPFTMDNENICDIMIKENHAVEYWGGKKVKVWG
jgi:micrococcal nuclease|tara:strand:- start:512 stop:874 length:363 start_codon:yes stop_codon:yes gene_type:complete